MHQFPTWNLAVLLCLALCAACGDNEVVSVDAGLPSDAGEKVEADAGTTLPDAGTDDAGATDSDAGTDDAGTSAPDAGEPDGGACGVEICDDGIDNDCDELADCLDPDCATFVCRAAASPCDLPERCDGKQAACPADEVVGNGWETGTSLGTPRFLHAGLISGGRAYVVGGVSSTTLDGVTSLQSAPLDAKGLPGTWRTERELPEKIFGHFAFVSGEWLYVLRGCSSGIPCTASTSGAISALVLPDGSLMPWRYAGDMPDLSSYAAVVLNNRVYVIGGREPGFGSSVAAVYSAPTNIAGGLGAFRLEAAMPGPRFGAAAAVLDGRIYVVGGCVEGGFACTAGALTEVLRAEPGPDGEIVSWHPVTPLPEGRWAHALFAKGDRLYVLGGIEGRDSANGSTALLSLEITANGAAPAWVEAGSLPARNYAHTAHPTESGLLMLGGATPGSEPRATFAAPDGGFGRYVCRAAVGPCDAPEVCDGLSPQCPADAIRTDGEICRPSAGSCDPDEYCDGVGTGCPADELASAGTECRPQWGDCDVAEYCTGSSPDCPEDQFVAAGTVCNPSLGACDPEEVCTGSDASCPVDERLPADTVCNPSQGVCDPAEVCNGIDPECPTDLRASGLVCRAAVDACDAEEYCDGQGVDCPADEKAPDLTACGEFELCIGGVCQ